MDFGLGLGQAAEDRGGALFVRVGQARVGDDAQDVFQRAGRLLFAHVDDGVGGGDAGALHLRRVQRPAVEREAGERRAQVIQREAGVQHRAQQHVAADAGEAVQVGDAHGVYSAMALWRLITAARYPAPKPLSMLTTETPAAQELSIASSGARPPKLAP